LGQLDVPRVVLSEQIILSAGVQVNSREGAMQRQPPGVSHGRLLHSSGKVWMQVLAMVVATAGLDL
jgi:hypothetical protein